MKITLTDKKAIVTGASRGIGKAIARSLAKAGATVICIGRSQKHLEDTAQKIKEEGGAEPKVCVVDVSSEVEVKAAVADILATQGGVDILVNNAGITRDGLLMRMSVEDWDATLDTNLKGAFLWTKALARTMSKQRYGRIINMSSIIGLIGNAGQSNYAASKAGLLGFTKSVAKELASRGVTCNAVCPGFIQTEMTDVLSEDLKNKLLEAVPLKRLGDAKDIANVVTFLASDNASYITGQEIVVDGGMVM